MSSSSYNPPNPPNTTINPLSRLLHHKPHPRKPQRQPKRPSHLPPSHHTLTLPSYNPSNSSHSDSHPHSSYKSAATIDPSPYAISNPNHKQAGGMFGLRDDLQKHSSRAVVISGLEEGVRREQVERLVEKWGKVRMINIETIPPPQAPIVTSTYPLSRPRFPSTSTSTSASSVSTTTSTTITTTSSPSSSTISLNPTPPLSFSPSSSRASGSLPLTPISSIPDGGVDECGEENAEGTDRPGEEDVQERALTRFLSGLGFTRRMQSKGRIASGMTEIAADDANVCVMAVPVDGGGDETDQVIPPESPPQKGSAVAYIYFENDIEASVTIDMLSLQFMKDGSGRKVKWDKLSLWGQR